MASFGGNIKKSISTKTFLILFGIFIVTQTSQAFHSSCRLGLNSLFKKSNRFPSEYSSISQIALQTTFEISKKSFQFFFYPVHGPIKFLGDLKKLSSSKMTSSEFSNEILFHHTPIGLGFAALALKYQNDYTSAFEILSSIPELNGIPPRGPIVIVDAFQNENDLMRWGPALLALWYSYNYPDVSVHLLRSISPMDLIPRLEQIQKSFGEIDRIEFASHGRPGVMEWGNLNFDSEGVVGFPKTAALKSGATLRFFNCSLAQGDEGEKLARALGKVFLPKGGKIVLATQPVVAFWGDLFLGTWDANEQLGLNSNLAKLAKFAQTPLLVLVDALTNRSAITASHQARNSEPGPKLPEPSFEVYEILAERN